MLREVCILLPLLICFSAMSLSFDLVRLLVSVFLSDPGDDVSLILSYIDPCSLEGKLLSYRIYLGLEMFALLA